MKEVATQKIIKKLLDTELKKEINSACHYFFYQPVLPKGTKEKFGK